MPDQQLDEETLRKLQEQLSKAPPIAGFQVSGKTREAQRKKFEEEQAERERKRQQQALNPGQPRSFTPSDMFLKALAQVYDLPPEAKSFPKVIVPILMASTVIEFSAEQKVLVGKFAGAQELPPIQIAKQAVIAQGGNLQSQPELAVQLALLAASNPDMQRDGVEIVGVTEEDKMMLLAAADMLGLKVLNRDQIKVDQNQAARKAKCEQAMQNLQQWSIPGNAPAPSPSPGNEQDDPDNSAQPQPVVSPQPTGNNGRPSAAAAAAGAVPAAEAVRRAATAPSDDQDAGTVAGNKTTGPKPGNGAKNAAEQNTGYDDLSDDQKKAMRQYFRDSVPGLPPMSDDKIDAILAPNWEHLRSNPDIQQIIGTTAGKAPGNQAKAAPAPLTQKDLQPPEAPKIPPRPIFEPAGKRDWPDLLQAEQDLLSKHAESEGWKPEIAPAKAQESWHKLKETSREKRLAEALKKVDEKDRPAIEAEIEKQRGERLSDDYKKYDAQVRKEAEDHKADVNLFNGALKAIDPAVPLESPALKPVEDRKFSELLPAEKKLLQEYAKQKEEKENSVGRKWTAMKPEDRKKRFEEASQANKELAFDAAQEQEKARKLLSDAAASAKAKAPAQAAGQDKDEKAAASEPIRTWAELTDDERAVIRLDIARQMPDGGKPFDDPRFEKIWNETSQDRGSEWQKTTLEQAKIRAAMEKAPNSASARIEQEKQVKAAVPPRSATERLAQEQGVDEANPKRDWSQLSDEERSDFVEDANRTWPKKDGNKLYTEEEIAAGWNSIATGAYQAEAMAEAQKRNGVFKASQAEPAEPVGPVAVAAAPAAPQRHWLKELKDWFMNTVWTPFASLFKTSQTPAPQPHVEPALADLPLNIDTGADQAEPRITLPAPGVEAAAKKPYDQLLPAEKGLLKADMIRREGTFFGNAPADEWNGLDEAGRTALFNEAFANVPQKVQDRIVEEQKAQTAAPALDQEPPQHEQPVVKGDATPVTPPVLKNAEERSWNELLDAEKEAVAAGLSDNAKEAEAEWEKADAETRKLAMDLGLQGNPELKAKVDSAVKAENERLAVNPAAVIPSSSAAERIVQAETTPPVSGDARNAQNDAVVLPVVEIEEIPKDDAAFEAALAAQGLSHADLMGKSAEDRKDIIARIKHDLATAGETPPPAAAALAKGEVTSTFNFNVDKIRELPPSADARKVIDRGNLPKAVDREKFALVYQQIRAEVIMATPGSRITQQFLGNAARKNHTEELLGHKGLTSPEAHVILDALRAEGLTTGKKDTHRNPSFAVDDWESKLASHYGPSGPQPT